MSEQEVKESEVASDLSSSAVVTKYHSAADIVNGCLTKITSMCVPGGDIYQICKAGDTYIETEAAKIYNKKGKKVEKGIAFPTCISVNEVACNFSPLKDESIPLSEGDVVKIELGCHFDGYMAMAGHTLVAQSESKDVEGRKADVIMAAYTAAELAAKTIQVGKRSNEVTEVIQKACKDFNCTPIMGSYSHQLKRHVVDDKKVIPNSDSFEDKVEPFNFEANEVYEVNVIVSTGEGKLKESALRTTVFKRAVETTYTLRTQMTRNFINTVNKQFPLLPFSLNALEELKSLKLGVAGAVKHELLTPYTIMQEKSGEFVAVFKYTILLLPNGVKKVTGIPFNQMETMKSQYEISDPILTELLSSSTKKKKKKNKTVAESPSHTENFAVEV